MEYYFAIFETVFFGLIVTFLCLAPAASYARERKVPMSRCRVQLAMGLVPLGLWIAFVVFMMVSMTPAKYAIGMMLFHGLGGILLIPIYLVLRKLKSSLGVAMGSTGAWATALVLTVPTLALIVLLAQVLDVVLSFVIVSFALGLFVRWIMKRRARTYQAWIENHPGFSYADARELEPFVESESGALAGLQVLCQRGVACHSAKGTVKGAAIEIMDWFRRGSAGTTKGLHTRMRERIQPEEADSTTIKRPGVEGGSGTVAILLALRANLSGWALVRPERFVDRAADAVVNREVDFESHEFSQAFDVQASDRKFAYTLIDPRMMEKLLERREWTIEAIGGWLCVRTNWLSGPDEFDNLIAFALALVERVPRIAYESE